MDTSEQYIKMCDCPEIQGGWEPARGDFYTHQQGATRVVVVRDVGYTRRLEFYRSGYSNRWGTPTWLPRQDQLQEMLGDFDKQIDTMDEWIGNGMDDPLGIPCYWAISRLKTWEQLWLAFVMKEKFNKVWDGEQWQTQP